jgi:heme A synthase
MSQTAVVLRPVALNHRHERQVIFSRADLVWPAAIAALGLALIALMRTDAYPALRLPAAIGFLLVCPGMALVRLLRIHSPLLEWMLALAVSIALDGLVGSIFIYSETWAPETVVATLLLGSVALALVQLVLLKLWPPNTRRKASHVV